MTDERVLTGGCQCGAVRYRVEGPPLDTYNCHCHICRRAQGAAFGTYSIWPEARFTLEQGESALGTYDTSPGAHRRFCSTCGCHIFAWIDGGPGNVWVSTPTLDGGADPGNLDATLRHIYVAHKASWHTITDDLPQHDEWEEER